MFAQSPGWCLGKNERPWESGLVKCGELGLEEELETRLPGLSQAWLQALQPRRGAEPSRQHVTGMPGVNITPLTTSRLLVESTRES